MTRLIFIEDLLYFHTPYRNVIIKYDYALIKKLRQPIFKGKYYTKITTDNTLGVIMSFLLAMLFEPPVELSSW